MLLGKYAVAPLLTRMAKVADCPGVVGAPVMFIDHAAVGLTV